MRNKETGLLLVLMLLMTPLSSQVDTLLMKTMSEHIHPLRLSEEGWQGEGAALLDAALKGSQFALIGEQHGIREVGQFTRALLHAASDHGYRHVALEVSPMMAETLVQKVAAGKDALAQYSRDYPFAVPFYDNHDDFSMLEAIVSQQQCQVWGLDQVFIAEPRTLMAKLVELAPSQQARAMAEGYLEQAHEGAQKAIQGGQFDAVILFHLEMEDYEKLAKAFDGEPQARRILEEMKATRSVYQAWFDGRYYDNNKERILLMKHHLRTYYREALKDEPQPKVIFKFGANHMTRGLTPVNVFDIGNMAHEIALLNGKHSVHILFNGLKGTYHHALEGAQSYDKWEDLDTHVRAALEKRGSVDGWYLIDLRPLRALRMKGIDPALKSKIFGFDFWVLVPETKATSPF